MVSENLGPAGKGESSVMGNATGGGEAAHPCRLPDAAPSWWSALGPAGGGL